MFAKLLILIFFPAALFAQEKAWEKEWNGIVAAAKKEGRAVVAGWIDPEVRREVPAKFTARFGIPIEYLAGRASETSARLRAERQAGLYTVDVFLVGIDTVATILYPQKMLDPIRHLLILPEVVDPTKWRKGGLWFVDPEEKYVLRLFNYLTGVAHINTDQVKPSEFQSVKYLLDPKWKEKISIIDPTVPGGGNTAAEFFLQLGEDFVKKLYIDQKPVLSRDRRQMAEWVARGKTPISLNAEVDELKRLRDDGFPVTTLYSLPDFPGTVSAAWGQVVMLNQAPHPNAARLFINWIASREGLEAFSRAAGAAPTRKDIDAASFLPFREAIPVPGVNYFDVNDWEFTLTQREKARLRMKEILRR
jgi:iron(III) transport system substrate-binding protein